jgi:hypothetical protein
MENLYHALTVLRIYYNETEHWKLIIQKKDLYHHISGDEDDPLYEEHILKDRQRHLEVYMTPIMIYNNNIFIKPICQLKYKHLIDKYITKYGKSWSDIIRIVKVEERIDAKDLIHVEGGYEIRNAIYTNENVKWYSL